MDEDRPQVERRANYAVHLARLERTLLLITAAGAAINAVLNGTTGCPPLVS